MGDRLLLHDYLGYIENSDLAVHTNSGQKTVTLALRQNGSDINTRNTWCMNLNGANNKQHAVFKLLRLALNFFFLMCEYPESPGSSTCIEQGAAHYSGYVLANVESQEWGLNPCP